MSDIVICPNCEGPLTDSWLERAMDGSSGKRCESCTKAYHNPYGAAAELPIFKANLLEAKRHLKRTTEDLVTATTALEAAQAQIAALKIEVAGMTKERDDLLSSEYEATQQSLIASLRAERDAALADLAATRADLAEAQANARIAWGTLAEVKRNHEEELERLSIDHADTLVLINAQREKFERDAEQSRAELANMQKERDEAVQERDHNLLLSGDISCMETDKPGCGYCNSCLRDQCDFAVQRADAAEEKLRAAEEEIARLRDVEAECSSRAHGEAMLKEQYDGIYAAYQSVVAALQECGATIYASTDSYEELWRRAEIARTAIADSAATGDYVRELEAVYKEAKLHSSVIADAVLTGDVETVAKAFSSIDALDTLIAAVDARRGGGPEEKWLPADTCDKCGGAAYHERGCPERDVALRPARRGGGEGAK